MKQRLLLVAVVASFVLAIGVAVVAAAPGTPPPPTGEAAHAQSVLEPVFNAENYGEVGYVSTPNGTQHPVPSNPRSWSPIYVVEYPVSSTIVTSGTGATGPLNCIHYAGTGTDNCPSHGNGIAGLAAACPPLPVLPGSASCAIVGNQVRAVYARGAAGHDHVMDFPGGADFNVAWEPVAVLFTNATAANTRLLTDTAISNAIAAGNAIAIPLPGATFHCALVSDRIWSLSTPVPIG